MGFGCIAALTERMLKAMHWETRVIFAFVLEPDAHRLEVCLRGCGCSPVAFACPWAGSWCLCCCAVCIGRENLSRLDSLLEVSALCKSFLVALSNAR